MKKLERILWIIVALAIVGKLLRLPMTGFLLVLSFSVLSFMYFFLSWILFPSPERKDQNLVISIISGVVMGVATTAILFNLQLWPMSRFYLLISLPGLLMMAVIGSVFRNSSTMPQRYIRGLFIRSLPLLVFCSVLAVLPGGTLTRIYYRNDPFRRDLLLRYNSTNDLVERTRCRQLLDSLDGVREHAY